MTVATNQTGVTVTKLYNGSSEVAKSNGSNWSASGTGAVIKKAYLATLSAGTVTFKVVFSDGDERTLTVTITDTTE